MPLFSNMDGPRDCDTEWRKSDTERQISYDIAYLWNKKKIRYKWTYLQNRSRFTDVENKLMVNNGRKGSGMNWEGLTYTYYYKVDS